MLVRGEWCQPLHYILHPVSEQSRSILMDVKMSTHQMSSCDSVQQKGLWKRGITTWAWERRMDPIGVLVTVCSAYFAVFLMWRCFRDISLSLCYVDVDCGVESLLVRWEITLVPVLSTHRVYSELPSHQQGSVTGENCRHPDISSPSSLLSSQSQSFGLSND